MGVIKLKTPLKKTEPAHKTPQPQQLSLPMQSLHKKTLETSAKEKIASCPKEYEKFAVIPRIFFDDWAFNLQSTEWRFLLVAYDICTIQGYFTPTDITKCIKLSRPWITKIITTLEELGLLVAVDEFPVVKRYKIVDLENFPMSRTTKLKNELNMMSKS